MYTYALYTYHRIGSNSTKHQLAARSIANKLPFVEQYFKIIDHATRVEPHGLCLGLYVFIARSYDLLSVMNSLLKVTDW